MITKIKDDYIIRYEYVQEDSKYYIILMEYFSGKTVLDCLKRYIMQSNKPFPEEFVQYIIKEIAKGIKVLHRNKIFLKISQMRVFL